MIFLPMHTDAHDITVRATLDGVLLDVEALWRGARVGYVWCIVEDDGRLLIGELNINDQVPTLHPLVRRLFDVLGIPCKTRSFRDMGVGRRLMHEVISKASEAGISEIWGSVTQDDIARTPHLLDRYRHLGFTVLDADRECIRAAANKVVMNLKDPRPIQFDYPPHDRKKAQYSVGPACSCLPGHPWAITHLPYNKLKGLFVK